MKLRHLILTIVLTLQSCSSAYLGESDFQKNKRAKQYFRIYRRIGDDALLHVYRNYIILKPRCMTYEQYSDSGLSVIGKYTIKNDTLTMRHEQELVLSDSIYVHKIKNKDVCDYYPQRFIIHKDSLIDITNYYEDPLYFGMFVRGREDYVLIK